MNKNVKRIWLKALRSGKYKQGKTALKPKDNKFCCLGVLCDLHAKKFKKKWHNGSYLRVSKVLPRGVRSWSGLIVSNPSIEHKDDTINNLAEANDKGKTFKQIANIIEKQL